MSTQVKVINRPLPKAKAIIVGYKKGVNKVQIDKIVLHTAFTLSDEVYLIENVQITPQDKLLYICGHGCGHGSADKQKIGGRKIREVADILIEKGWTGQQIYLTSCKSGVTLRKSESIGVTLNGMLRDYLVDKVRNGRDKKNIIKTILDTKNTPMKHCVFKSKQSSINIKQNKKITQILEDQIDNTLFVQSDATGSTITLKSDEDEPEINVIELSSIDEFICDIRANFIDNKITKLDSIEINKANLTYLKEQNELYYKEMQKYKKDLLMKYGCKKKSIIYMIKELKDKFEEEYRGKM